MTPELCKTIIAIVETGSFVRASEKVGLTPSAVSRAVATLEEQWGFAVFSRTNTGITLTPEGKQMYPCICDMCRSKDILDQRAAQILGVERGTVRIATLGSVCRAWIPAIFKSFISRHPNIKLTLSELTSSKISEAISIGEVDIGIATLSGNKNINEIPLYDEPMYCIVKDGYYPNDKKVITVSDLKKMHFYTPKSAYDSIFQPFWKQCRIKPDYEFTTGENALMAIVASGLGACIVPESYLFFTQPYPLKAYPIEPKLFRIIGLMTKKKTISSPATQKMIQHILFIINKK